MPDVHQTLPEGQMLAYVVHAYGPQADFQPLVMAQPQAGVGEVVIKVAATSVNPLDIKIRTGLVAAGPACPAILHGDVAGVVTQVGEGVSQFKVGDAVFGFAGGLGQYPGALAEYMCAPAALLALKPECLSFAEAAALPVVFITAWQALVKRAQVQAGEKVLVHAGLGGVGHLGIQVAKALGAHVYTSVSTEEKAQLAQALGADVCILYPQQSPADYVQAYTQGQGFDVVFDTVGGDNLAASMQSTQVGGRLVTINARSTQDLSPLHARNLRLDAVFIGTSLLHGLGIEEQQTALQTLCAWVQEGKIKVVLDPHLFAMSDALAAHEYQASGQALGKVVILR
ncbi:NADPH2:quinone reductase [Allopseudospirillum japonicum]|uniref:NADPH2:quinone reductase n=1 Tax=Allopseudospirillum japonicum TaxID=64971 RepID=A0A1H6RX97_9GAMM|nr:zinc-dependent alcohol dehydrogenase family protein [Allopseudospirillum japonicum]SEI55812.1 NADPH2:quinone reductase [Allopseudospirillum japonicum]